ncbi:hypothetical protein FE257_006131 [Aspergillus nanangensis]|uniref:SIS domain-containing protein n=1 Tax=Aspergillus nanangensis TaxID=2582783 RepID=A0AAD4GU35_ASPNN|nr:hypothetical protein FE257_006131 [Aspergillus nanangensis]
MVHLHHCRQQQLPAAPFSRSRLSTMKKDRIVPDDFDRLPLTPPDPHGPVHLSIKDNAVTTAVQVISTERAALEHLEQLYETNPLAQENLARAVNQIAHSVRNGGKLVCCGVGKSGKIAQKLEATMNSLGIYSAFLHPTEALHGDLGMIRPHDTLLLISFSGRTPELQLLLPHIPSTVPVIAITAHLHPATCPLLLFHPPEMGILLPAPIHEDEESSFGVCAPTSSTTVALSLGDALAIATARRLHTSPGRGPAEIFKSFHPGGAIGAASASLFTPMSMSTASFPSTSSDDLPTPQQSHAVRTDEPIQLSDIMVPIDQIPTVSTTGPIRLLDILLTAIQHPDAKSWVSLSPSDIVPPRNLRSLSQTSHVDLDVVSIASLGLSCSVPRKNWVRIPCSTTVDDARQLVSETSAATGVPAMVIAVMRDESLGDCVGVIEADDLWDEP